MKTREELFNRIWQMGLGNGTIDDDEIQGILNLPTQAQLDCPYCHDPFLDLSLQSVDEMFPEDAYCNFEKDGLNYGSGEFEDGNDKTIHANFCPMCGRKLGDE